MKDRQAEPSTRPSSLLVVISGNDRYGVRTVNLTIIEGLLKRGWEIVVASMASGPFEQECRQRGYEVVVSPHRQPPHYRGSLVARAHAFATSFKHARQSGTWIASIASSHGCKGIFFSWPNHVPMVMHAARSAKLPGFWHMPNTLGVTYPFDTNRRFYQHCCRKGNIVPLANSAFTASTLGTHPVKPEILHLAVDHERFNPTTVTPIPRAQLDIPEDVPVIGVVARLQPSKGQDRLLQAMINLGHHAQNAHLILLGNADDTHYLNHLQQLAARGSMQNRLQTLGLVSDPERYYPAMDFSVNCRIDPEPFGLSVIESMCMGTPVLAHALGGPAETVVDDQTGWLYDDPSVSTLEQSLMRAFQDQPRWPEMRRAARRHVLECFTEDIYISKFLAIASRHSM